jgi:DNA helicase II / ATP-dependent DNA helicase PcrA
MTKKTSVKKTVLKNNNAPASISFSSEQLVIEDWVKNGTGHAVIEAVAGSGKTFTLVNVISPHINSRSIFCAFNNHIAEEIKKKNTNSNMKVSTIHGMGLAAIKRTYPNAQIDKSLNKKKYVDKIKEFYSEAISFSTIDGDPIPNFNVSEVISKNYKIPSYEIDNAFAFARNSLYTKFNGAALEIVDRYSIELDPSLFTMMDMMFPALMKWGASMTSTIIDYTDMIWLPTYLKDEISLYKYDWVLVDEAQDLNKAQKEIVLNSISSNGRIVAVGDPNQAIYSFAGADYHSFIDIKKTLSAKSLPLATCYRCPPNHISMAKKIVPHIMASKTEKGIIDNIDYQNLPSVVKENDLVICRITSRLISLCYFFIANKIKATVKGRDIGIGLKTVLYKMGLPREFDKKKFDEVSSKFFKKEADFYMKNNMEDMMDSLNDKIDCIKIIFENSSRNIKTISDFEAEIDSIFDDNVNGVVLCTVHRAKGLEADSVFILDEHLMPYYRAKTEEDYRQEMNLRYVALTRSKENLYFSYSPQDKKSPINLTNYQ